MGPLCTLHFFHFDAYQESKNIRLVGNVQRRPHYGHGGINLLVFFGVSVSQTYLLCNLDDVNKYDSITIKSINSMRYMEFVIGIFDNSQIITELKFHSDGNSSSVTLVISRMFIKPMVPHGYHIFQFPIALPYIIYLHQKIPSAYGMPAFEGITSIITDVYSNIKYRTVNSSTDITGAQV